jgi:serine/threonine protein kinase
VKRISSDGLGRQDARVFLSDFSKLNKAQSDGADGSENIVKVLSVLPADILKVYSRAGFIHAVTEQTSGTLTSFVSGQLTVKTLGIRPEDEERNIKQRIAIAHQIIRGVSFLHSLNISHRNLQVLNHYHLSTSPSGS